MPIQDGLVPPLHPEEASGLISGSEQILKNYANKVSLNANDLKALIEDDINIACTISYTISDTK